MRFSRATSRRREERAPLLAVAERNRRRRCLLALAVCVALVVGALAVSAAVAGPLATQRLTLDVPGDTGVRITGAEGDSEFFCDGGKRCTFDFPQFAAVSLSATGLFFGWTGDCPTSAPICTLSLNEDKDVGLRRHIGVFAQRDTDGTAGFGTVTVTPPGVSCPPTCAALYTGDTSVTLAATPADGYFFYRWRTCPTFDFAATCTLQTNVVDNELGAVFLPNATLQVAVTGIAGAVTVSPGGDCDTSQPDGHDCKLAVTPGSRVTLTPKSVPGAQLGSWSVPECPGTGACTITMDSRLRAVVAAFLPTRLTVVLAGNGSVTSSESPPKISCGADESCDADYSTFAEVTLTASPNGFRGWSGVCAQAGTAPTCTFRLSGGDVVGTWFDGSDQPPQIIPPRIPFPMQVRKTGDGAGTVTSERSKTGDAIRCGASCDAYFEQGETAVLVAEAEAGSRFDGWKTPGDRCSTGLTCRFEALGASRLQAAFAKTAKPCARRKVGSARADRLDGGTSGDAIYGRAGNDRIRGFGGDDCLYGEGGKDVLYGGAGHDVLSGGGGADTLDGGPGEDVLNGGAGPDVIAAADGSRDTISCGRGRDVVRADKVDQVTGCERVRRT